jgi:hypothetical protein
MREKESPARCDGHPLLRKRAKEKRTKTLASFRKRTKFVYRGVTEVTVDSSIKHFAA